MQFFLSIASVTNSFWILVRSHNVSNSFTSSGGKILRCHLNARILNVCMLHTLPSYIIYIICIIFKFLDFLFHIFPTVTKRLTSLALGLPAYITDSIISSKLLKYHLFILAGTFRNFVMLVSNRKD